MGLDTSHGAWHGAYSAFYQWRKKIQEAAGLPPLEIMEGFYAPDEHGDPLYLLKYKFPKGDELEMGQLRSIFSRLPIKWECLKPSPLHELLNHSDCDGHLNWSVCGKIADELEKLLPLLSKGEVGGHIGNYYDKTVTFIAGLRLAHKEKKRLEFR